MYKYRKRPSKAKKIFLVFIQITTISVLSIFGYSMYLNVIVNHNESDVQNYESLRLMQNETIKSNIEEDITIILEHTTRCVVGISKIKEAGNSIFLNNSTQELGLGTGMVITNNRIYSYKLACSRK